MKTVRSLDAEPKREASARKWAAFFSIVLVAAVLSPVIQNWREEPVDGFPLSFYAMFTRSRGETVRVTYLAAVDEQGQRHRLHYRFLATGGFNQARKQINRYVAEGKANKLCNLLAERIAELEFEPFRSLAEVQVVTGEFHLNDWFAGDRRALRDEVRASCAIPWRDSPEQRLRQDREETAP